MNGLWVDDVNCHICCCKPYTIMYVINSMLCGDDILYVVNHAMMMLCMLKVSMLSCDESYMLKSHDVTIYAS